MRPRRVTAARAPLALLAAALALAVALPARAGQLVTGVSTDRVSIESTFTGAKIVVFGTIERDAGATPRPDGYDVVVVARGPKQDMTVRRKARIAGIWINRDWRHYIEAPSYLAMLAARPFDEIADEQVLKRYQISFDHLILLEPGSPGGQPGPETEFFREAVVRLMGERDLYVEDAAGVRFLGENLFMAEVRLPAHITVGTYRVEVFLFSGGSFLGRTEAAIEVHKSGLEQLVTTVATTLPLLYGLAVVAMAIFFGWFAGVVFRRD